MTRTIVTAALILTAPACQAAAQDYKVAKIDTPAPVGEISPEIAALLQTTGFRVAQGDSQVLCEVWPAKEWPIAADAATSAEILYPLTAGQLIGAARFPRKAADFRDQEVPAGIYVVRYGQQPVDGAHVGTSPTRDFFVLIPAAKDRDPQVLDYKALIAASKQTTGTEHPGILSLQKPADSGGPLSIRHEADKEWTIVRFVGKVKQGGATKDLPVELVVVGKAAE
jgi:hypothetical protein